LVTTRPASFAIDHGQRFTCCIETPTLRTKQYCGASSARQLLEQLLATLNTDKESDDRSKHSVVSHLQVVASFQIYERMEMIQKSKHEW